MYYQADGKFIRLAIAGRNCLVLHYQTVCCDEIRIIFLTNKNKPSLCSNNLEEVRDEWERVKLAYEILRDPRTRKRFDRHEVLADPGAAVGRAAAGAALSGLAGVGSGLFAVGAFAFGKITGGEEQEQPESA
jgi:hypothetical protein